MRHLLCQLVALTVLLAQPAPIMFKGGTYDPAIPTPSQVLGYEIGDRFTDYRNLEQYFEALAGSSERIQRRTYGSTYGQRRLQILIISSPDNLRRLDEIKSKNKLLTDPRAKVPRSEIESILDTSPAIVWLSYGVHGNEACSPEAAILTAYQLVAGTDARTMRILENIIVIIDPAVNPDGRERYVQWVNSVTGSRPNPNPDALEHSEPWPRGRTNHYYFDLNRDWAWMTQKETQARIPLYREWMPHVHVDFHEMSYQASYFFFPAAVPVHSDYPPEVKKWGRIYGEGNAAAFDELGISYYTQEFFDLFYPGYGDSWPTFNGAIGMTYEQAGQVGVAIKKANGETLTLRDRARNHFITGMATLETTVKNKKERLKDFRKFWETALRSTSRTKGFIIPPQPDPNRAARLVNILLAQGIEVHRLKESVQLTAQKFFAKQSSRENFPAGTYVVSLEQPQSRLAKAVLEPQTALQDTFFYDVSAWSLPVAFGIPAYLTESPLPPSAELITALPIAAGGLVNGKASYAYLIPWERNDAVKVAWQLLEKGFALNVASRSFEVDKRTFGAGTIIAFVGNNSDSLHDVIGRLAVANGVDVYSASTGLTEKGINLGSSRVRPIRRAEIAVVADTPVRANGFGEMWYMFDQEYRIPFTAIRSRELSEVNLSKYQVIILPDGGDYRSVFDSTRVDKLKRWVQDGGILIGIEGAARFFLKSRSGLTSATLVTEKKDDDKTTEEKEKEKQKKEEQKRLTLFEKEERQRIEQIPGSIFSAFVDASHPIGYGYDRELYVLKGNAIPVELNESAHTVARFSPDTLHISGYSVPDLSKRVANSAYIIEFSQGKGKIVLFTEAITFRRFWVGLDRLLLNAVLFLPRPE
ncbi:MAG TPA: M14 family metallopeptidase [Bacteroidota bacterium]|nr:M14 family metallopeptidase [Bacteroidota bacterium]